jgi:hypothetical protein
LSEKETIPSFSSGAASVRDTPPSRFLSLNSPKGAAPSSSFLGGGLSLAGPAVFFKAPPKGDPDAPSVFGGGSPPGPPTFFKATKPPVGLSSSFLPASLGGGPPPPFLNTPPKGFAFSPLSLVFDPPPLPPGVAFFI